MALIGGICADEGAWARIIQMKPFLLCLAVGFALILASCSPPSVPEGGMEGSYPIETAGPVSGAYPVGHPQNTQPPKPAGIVPPFSLTKPILEGSEAVEGSGPSGVPIILSDITFGGVVLGQGMIGPNGRFSIAVAPLEQGHRIGLTLGELGTTQWTPADFQFEVYNGEEAMLIPDVGFFFDSAMVVAR